MQTDSTGAIGNVRKIVLAAGLFAVLAGALSGPAIAGGNWNDEGIRWMSYPEGLEAAKSQSKPICLVFYTEWCPHCVTYSGVFHDPKVVEQSKRFVMIRLDRDKNREISKQYAADGDYIPRTHFLSREGKFDPDIHAPHDRFLYFFDEKDPASVLAGMDAALGKLGPADTGKPPAPATK